MSKSIQELKSKIEALQSYKKSIQSNLMYADHGAYGQDKARIYDLEIEISGLERQLNELVNKP